MIEKYNHHKKEVSVVAEFKGKHRDLNVCQQGCSLFRPGESNNCAIAEMSFQLSKQVGIVTVMECKDFTQLKPSFIFTNSKEVMS